MIAIISALYDAYDELHAICPQDGVEIDWVLVTDDAALASGAVDRKGWRVVYEPRPDLHPNRAAKRPKILPWCYTAAEQSVWIDASFSVLSPTFAAEALACAHPVAQFTHPWRDCIYDEADLTMTLPKYDGEPIAAQVAHYRAQGHPAHWGLWATGVIARHHTQGVKAFGYRWLADCLQWSYQDQLSHPPALRTVGLRPESFPGTYLDHPWLEHRPSVRHIQP